MSPRLQNAAHLLQSLVKVREVTYTESRCHSVVGIVGIREVQTVFLLEGDDVLQSFLCHLLPTNLHHPLADVCPHQTGRFQHLCGEDGEASCTCGDVENCSG